MTDNQMISYFDQMDAARKEFLALWQKTKDSFHGLRPEGMTTSMMAHAQQIAWDIFKEAKGIKPTTTQRLKL